MVQQIRVKVAQDKSAEDSKYASSERVGVRWSQPPERLSLRVSESDFESSDTFMCDREAVGHLECPMSDNDLKADIGGRVRNVRF